MPRDLPTACRCAVAAALLISISVLFFASVSTLRKPEMVTISYAPASP